MDNIFIEYRFFLGEDRRVDFRLELNPDTLELVFSPVNTPPAWTALEFHQCANCPLNKEKNPQCPPALNLVDIVEHFREILSYTEIEVEVITSERIVRQRTSAQRAISSLMGLIIGTSGCPHTTFFKSMARHHLPLASQEETLYRATSSYLLMQYLLKKMGKPADFNFDGLDEIYRNMEIVNASIAKRLRSASKGDGTVNAIVLLDLHAKTLPMATEDNLENIQYLFEPFIRQLTGKNL